MTISDYETFKKEFFDKLRKESKKCLKVIEKHRQVIEYYFTSKTPMYVRDFLKQFNYIICSQNIIKFNLFEKILYHDLFTQILHEFRVSDVLILACKQLNPQPDTVLWLLTMGIDYRVQDTDGMTALMYAVRNPILEFAVIEMMKTRGDFIDYVDNKGNNALFHATTNIKTFTAFFKYVEDYAFNLNHKNYDQEGLFLYCCRYRKINDDNFYDFLCQKVPIDPYETNIEGKTALMYMAEYFDYRRIASFVRDYKVDINYQSLRGHTVFSCFMNQYYRFFSSIIYERATFFSFYDYFRRATITFMTLVRLKCHINEPLDEYGTTATMILLKIRDMAIYNYLVEHNGKDYDLVIENRNDGNDRYPSVDFTDPVVQKNHQELQEWEKAILKDMSTKAG